VDPLVEPSVEPALAIAAMHDAKVGGEDWLGLAAVGDHSDLVGRQVADLEVGGDSALTWNAKDAELFSALPTDDGKVPQFLIGRVTSPTGGRPPELVVAVNGTLAGVLGAYERQDDGTWRFTGFIGARYREGANEVRAYEV